MNAPRCVSVFTGHAIADAPAWRLACAEAGFAGSAGREPFESLLSLIHEAAQKAPRLSALAEEQEVNLASEDIEAMAETCDQMLAHVERGGGLGWFSRLGKGKWGKLLESVTVRGRRPAP